MDFNSKYKSSKIEEILDSVDGKADKSSLAAVATSGSYNDLSNKPTIPAAVTESTVSGWGFTKNTGTYSKPSTGIPKSDLASAVQTSLGKADTALQSYTEQYKGTVTGVKVNGSTKSPSSGTVDIGNVVTSVKINGTTKSPSSGVVDLGTVVTDISGKQDKLVSGTNIKTINGESIVGSGDIVISGEGGSSSGGKEIVEVIVDSGSITFSGMGGRPSFEPNKIYYATTPVLESVGISSVIPPTEDIGEYSLHFSYANPGSPFFEAPSDWLWPNGIPTVEEGVSYELSVVATKLGSDYIYKAVLTPFKAVE